MSDIQKEALEKWSDSSYISKFSKWISEELVRQISKEKNEPDWLLEHRLKALNAFNNFKNPSYWPDLSSLNFDEICFYAKASEKNSAKDWSEVDPKIKETFDKLKIPEAERSVLAWVWAQYESETIYHSIKKKWEDKWVIFEDFDQALKKYPEMVKKYFSKCVWISDHKFSALHYAVLSWWTFLYIPNWVEVDEPLQAYFRMNAAQMWQFEHTLIIVGSWAKWSYIEWCSAPKYWKNALHAWCVEIFVEDSASFRYSSVENWSKDTFNLNTKRAILSDNSSIEWIWGQMWSKVTMLYPCSILKWDNSACEHLAIAVAWSDQNQDTWAKVIMIWKNTKSKIVSKSISKDWGISTYRWIVDIKPWAQDAVSTVECDALIFGDSISDTVPQINTENDSASITHEAKAWKISEDLLFYFETRWVSEEKAKAMIVNWFFSDIVKSLPLEYAVEMNRLIEMQMEGF